jgi:hypothetical protein
LNRFNFDGADLRDSNWMRYQSIWTPRIVVVTVYLALLVLASQLRDRDFEFVLEPDFWSPMITAWRLYFETWSIGNLPVPSPHPYMDGQYIVYAFGAEILRGITAIMPSLKAAFPNVDSYNLGAANLINVLAFAGAGAILFRTVTSITDSTLMGAAAALLLITAPSIVVMIGFVRCDYLSMLPIVALFCGGLQLARNRETATTSAFIGLALALITTIKITGCFFSLFLIVGVISRWVSRPAIPFIERKHFAIFALCFAVSFAFFMQRYWMYLDLRGIIENFLLSVEMVSKWTNITSPDPFYYYHITLLSMNNGATFILLYVIASVLIFRDALIKRDPVSVYLAISFAVFSVIAMLGFKYSRGGYHLLPIFITIIAVAVMRLRAVHLIVFGGAGALIILVLALQTTAFVGVAHSAVQRSIAVQETRKAARLWLKVNTSKGDPICIAHDSDWAVPLGDFKTVTGPFNFPYIDKEAMAKFAPPSVAEAEKACRAIVLNDFHQHLFDVLFSSFSPVQALAWHDFYDALRKSHPPHVFSSAEAAYGIKRVEIFDMKTRPE